MEKIKIISERCKSCAYCVKFCPKKILEISNNVNSKGYEYVCITDQEKCVSCCSCAKICPDGAIEVYK